MPDLHLSLDRFGLRGRSAACPSETEALYGIHAESFGDEEHLAAIQEEARKIVSAAFESAGL